MIADNDEITRFARTALGLPESTPVGVFPLRGRGSDRVYYRLRWNDAGRAIAVRYDPKRVENSYWPHIASFLQEIDIPVPRLIGHDKNLCLVVMEDLGDGDLWSLRDGPLSGRITLYEKTLAVVHRLHSFPLKDFQSRGVRLMEGFGPALYRWERDYFKEYYVERFCGITMEDTFARELESELQALAQRLEAAKGVLVHRDLQSQNVMIREGIPYLIDFQGMRFGCAFYDLGSLLCDPYVQFSDGDREGLLSFYYRLSETELDWSAFLNLFWEASAQRLMQALGAYGFLGLEKGLKSFLLHIPSGLAGLHRAASRAGSLHRLRELCEICLERGRRASQRQHLFTGILKPD